ncbi:hypothetical protein MMC07_002422 [Pseudocyphellaria aurata]|nr:hypothetical protein [Pseudocyphellaria aurata]
MSSSVTEIAIIPLSSGANIEDPSSPYGETWQASLNTIAGQKGFQRLYWGRQVESSNTIDFFVDWDSLQAHKDFIASPVYESFSKSFSILIDGNVLIYHTSFSPTPPSSALITASSLVAEHLTFYFPSTFSNLDISSWDDTFARFLKVVEQNAEGFKANFGGWISEELQHERVGASAKAYAAVFQWESVEKHKLFRNTDAFKKAIGPVREASRAIEMHHVIIQEC